MTENTINTTTEAATEAVETTEVKESWNISIPKPKFLTKKAKKTEEVIEENEKQKKKFNGKKFLKNTGLVSIGVVLGVVGKGLADKANETDLDEDFDDLEEAEEVEVEVENSENEEEPTE